MGTIGIGARVGHVGEGEGIKYNPRISDGETGRSVGPVTEKGSPRGKADSLGGGGGGVWF